MKRNGFAPMIVVAIVAVIAIGIVGYFILNSKIMPPQSQTSVQPKNASTQASSTMTTTTTASSSAIDSSWMTYTNEQYDVTFKYPPGWYVKSKVSAATALSLLLDAANDVVDNNGIAINVTTGTIQTILKDLATRLTIISKRQVIINNITWTVVTSNEEGAMANFADYYLQDGPVVLSFGGYDSDQNRDLIPRVLSTFRFTSSSSQAVASDIIDVGYTAPYDDGTGPNSYAVEQKLVFVSPSGQQIPVSDVVASRIASSSENLGPGIMPLNPLNSNQIILTTNDRLACVGYCALTNRIYSYDLGTGDLNLLYTVPKDPNGKSNVELQIIATQSSKVIFRHHIVGTGGVCDQTWDPDPLGNFIYFDLAKPDMGLQTYVAPVSKMQEAVTLSQECTQNL